MFDYSMVIIQSLFLVGGLISVYVGLAQRITKLEIEIKWIKQLLLNKKEVINEKAET